MARISVLVAVYNAEKYISRCLDSLSGQSFPDFEAVCVDDGSTDSSAAIIASAAERDSRFRLVRMPENGGQAKARNEGIKHCRGEFITFLDADDWYGADALEKIVKVFDNHPNTDCVLFDCVMVYPDGRRENYDGERFEVLGGREALEASISWRIHGIYAARAGFFKRFPFDDTCRNYSDDNTTRVHYYLSREVRQSGAEYFYFQNPGSATHAATASRMEWIKAADSMKRQLKALGCDDGILSAWETQRWRIIVDCYFFYYKNRRKMTAGDRRRCLGVLRRGWGGTVVSEVDGKLRRRPGFVPFSGRWRLFRAEEEIYFLLRGLLEKTGFKGKS